ncbi:pseudouridine synthase [Suillus plorans]|uniref:tRNA pseudouridine synthase 1 n=1 Tax=Suillus plorans TaxID=116603 RepID=A0A9P7AFD4_9AGAM|nr:pseudouridine synthase [Suillus plorans]KAG1788258.1 pseudouridine synthase [Suillus plorans]
MWRLFQYTIHRAPLLSKALRRRNIHAMYYDLQDSEQSHSPPAKRPITEVQAGISESFKRARIEHEEPEKTLDATEHEGPSDTPAADTKQGKRDAAGWAKSRRGKAKDTKNKGRRRGTRDQDKDGEKEGEEQSPRVPRLPKKQSALLIGFCGTGCNGMQIQPDVRTIEGVLFDALVRAGAVSSDNADDPVKVNLGRAARTDAGVHAAGNLVSMKLITAIPGVTDWVARVNEELPQEIRVWGSVRVQNSFNARMSCDSRKYTYFFPSYLLIPPKPGSGFQRAYEKHAQSMQGIVPLDSSAHSFWSAPESHSSTPMDDLLRKRSWRISSDQVELIRRTANKFEGTHNFHNFTVGREFGDRSNQRHMWKIEISDPAVYGDTEWISVLFHGQSFMLHQRKMMSALVLSCRTSTPSQVIDELYGPRIVMIPKMPALGLLLEYPIFDSYNKKVTSINEKLEPSHPDYRPKIDFEKHRESIDAFKQTFIYDNMRCIEDRDGVFDAWMRSIDSYGGDDLLYLNPKGIIPAAAVIKKGDKRENPFKEKRKFDLTSFPDKQGTPTIEDDEETESKLNKSRLEDMEG